MKLVLAAGCPCTGWEMVVSTLSDAGLGPAVDAIAGWQNHLLTEGGVAEPLQLRQPLQPDTSMQEKLARLLDDQEDCQHLVVSKCPWLLDFWAARYPQAQFLLFFTSAETALTQALICGVEPIQFVEDWKANMQHLMRFQRRYRHRSLLLSAEAANLYPHALVEATRRIGLSLQLPAESISRETHPLPEIERFLAHRVVAEDPSIGALQTELEARAQPLGDWLAQGLEVPLENLLKCYLQTRRDHEQLRSQLHDAQIELECAVLAKQEVEQTQAATRAELDEFKASTMQLEQAREKLEATNQSLETGRKEALARSELLAQQLQQIQEDLKGALLQKQALELTEKANGVELQQLTARIAEAEQARNKLEVTNQSLEAVSKESLEENELLLKQLHAVQEELEEIFLAKQEVEKTHKATGAELQQLQARMMQAEQAREKLEATNQSLETGRKEALARSELLAQQLQQVQEELKGAVLQRQALEQTEKATGAELQQLKARIAEAEQARKKLEVTNQSLEAASKESLGENELLLKQLHAVQEELEHYFLKYQETLTRQDSVSEEQAPMLEPTPEAAVERRPIIQRRGTAAWTNHTLIRTVVKPFNRPDKTREKLRRQIEVLNQSGLFDQKWYLAENPDVASGRIDPTEHYLRFGAAEGRNPSPRFDTVYYLQSNPDVAEAGVNPLLHYIEFGISEGRQACG